MDVPLSELVGIIKTAGPTGILAVWLYFEIKERKRLQRLMESVLIPMMSRHTKLIHTMNRMFGNERSSGSDDDE